MFFEKKSGIKELATITFSELPTHAFLHMDRKDIEVNHFSTFSTRD